MNYVVDVEFLQFILVTNISLLFEMIIKIQNMINSLNLKFKLPMTSDL